MEKSVFTPEYALLRAELVRIREEAGLTQRQLAKMLGVAHSWVAKVESGDRRLDVVELYRFLRGCKAQPAPVLKRLVDAFAKSKRLAKNS